ncbi:GntR family transcriptional regulator [Mucilaginibacter myungsuensis]|uniref:GntR family transcriptional regulator n=1 Tax=Mucilaginibacter myungsuensis TaxID=649104 RepID=A0A929KTP1_9SPHI|nr:GntR family transcriptional regulator [Mucilaginibacter myungsuensis]MBE9660987.1 GntR family transcriptional regulator [Mucilaginibacter myungsuensis]MDN3601033.1 GntR family transcriptional regulator [Mucilaginibacter myungsuensis]
MEFNDTQAIYLQIADHVCDQILALVWKDDEKIPSVRELAVMLEVNPNTVMRSYEQLQSQQIIYTKKGMGYFVTPNASHVIFDERRQAFISNELPALLKKMKALNIDIAELEQLSKQIH